MYNKELTSIMNITVESLARVQHDALKKHVLDTLDKVKQYIEEERYEDVKADLTFFSGGGDGWGCSSENNVINFDYTGESEMDILEVAYKLIELKKVISTK